LLIQQILGQSEPQKVRFVVAFEKETDTLLYKVLYSGTPYNPFAEDSLSVSILKHVLSDVSYQVQEDGYSNLLKFTSH